MDWSEELLAIIGVESQHQEPFAASAWLDPWADMRVSPTSKEANSKAAKGHYEKHCGESEHNDENSRVRILLADLVPSAVINGGRALAYICDKHTIRGRKERPDDAHYYKQRKPRQHKPHGPSSTLLRMGNHTGTA